MSRLALAFLLALPGAAAAKDSPTGALRWMAGQSATQLIFQEVAQLDIAPGGVIVVDPLAYGPGLDWPFVPVPAGVARFIVALEPDDSRVSKALLVFSDAEVSCGHDETSVGVDSGLAAFLDQPRAKALLDASDALGFGKDIYNDWFSSLPINAKPVVSDMAPLLSGVTFPMMSSGWGDGGYPVASLRDKDGAMVALYVDFMGKDDDANWLLPPECDGLPVTWLDLRSVSPSPL